MKIHSAAVLAVIASSTSYAAGKGIDLADFQSLLNSEFDSHSQEEALVAYDLEADFSSLHMVNDNADTGHLLCNNEAHMSGHSRQKAIRAAFDLEQVQMDIVYNGSDRTCVMTSMKPQKVTQFYNNRQQLEKGRFMSAQMMTSYMKMRQGLVSHIEETSPNEEVDKQLSFEICPLNEVVGNSKLETISEDIINRIRNEKESSTGRSLVASRQFAWTSEHLNSFNLSDNHDLQTMTKLQTKWNRHLAQGLDSTHGCAAMFDQMYLSFGAETSGTVYLDLGSGSSQVVDSSANADCVLSLAAALSAQPEVCSVESVVQPRTLNDIAQWITQTGELNKRPFWDADITGEGQIVQVSDTGLDTNHCHFRDATPGEKFDGTVQLSRRKVVQYVSHVDSTDYTNGHGTHVVGSILANRSTDGTKAGEDIGNIGGMAPNAKVAMFDIGTSSGGLSVPGVSSLFRAYSEAGAKFHSASWGSSTNSYTSRSRDFDKFAYDNDDFLISVAAGNSGPSYHTTGNPGTSKNIFSVGASESSGRSLYSSSTGPDYLAYFSSRGPTSDMRMKPDIVAPGHSVLSSGARPSEVGECEGPASAFPNAPGSSNYGIKYMSGTSMATPVVTGNAALVRQYLVDGFYEGGTISTPSSALIRAIIYNGATPLTHAAISGGKVVSVPYDNHQGMGRVRLSSSLPLDGENEFSMQLYDRVEISDGDTDKYGFLINDSCESWDEISATLVWLDPAGSSGCSKCIINDLDLHIEINGQRHYPNGLSEADDVNTAERVRKQVSAGDSINVVVSGSNIASSSQKYSLAITGCFDGSTPQIQMSVAPSVSPAPTAATTPAPTASCTDFENWKDSYGDGCEWYEQNDSEGCPSYGNYFDGGMGTPNEACCWCGGGNEYTAPPVAPVAPTTPAPVTPAPVTPAPVTPSPTESPSKAPTTSSSCSEYNEKRRKCNNTEGCSYRKRQGEKVCEPSLSEEECSSFTKKFKCKNKGCKWDKDDETCAARWP